MDNMLMQAAREAMITDFGTGSTDANQPQASVDVQQEPLNRCPRATTNPTATATWSQLRPSMELCLSYTHDPQLADVPAHPNSEPHVDIHQQPCVTGLHNRIYEPDGYEHAYWYGVVQLTDAAQLRRGSQPYRVHCSSWHARQYVEDEHRPIKSSIRQQAHRCTQWTSTH